MYRRGFLKLAGLAAVGATVRLVVPAWAEPAAAARRVTAPDGKIYRGDLRGHIFVSSDKGASWSLHTNLGSQIRIRRMDRDSRGRVRAVVGYRGRLFPLYLGADARSWMSV